MANLADLETRVEALEELVGKLVEDSVPTGFVPLVDPVKED
mgnify:CR=1 FL=1